MTRATVVRGSVDGYVLQLEADGRGFELSALDALELARNLQRHANAVLEAAGRSAVPVTKADLLPRADLESLESTPCGLSCSGCGTVLETERAFAEHFAIAAHDIRAGLWNLGHCPIAGR